MIQLESVSKAYGRLSVLNEVSLRIAPHSLNAIVGASGAGKSTLLHIMGTLDRPDSGKVFFEGTDLLQLDEKAQAHFRNRRLGFVFQFHHLLPEFSALENVSMPLLIGGMAWKEAREQAADALVFMGLQDRQDHRPSELSGGEQQRVAVARAIVHRPALLLADEPTGNLDTRNAAMVHDWFFRLRDEWGQTIVLITHNPELAQRADRTLTLTDGRLNEA
ncbi:ATP-binding cassette domain-containing protein [bacterium]|nr:ATP-binding cassette domain-containing protein [bacterium]